jgi:hypothetical protein
VSHSPPLLPGGRWIPVFYHSFCFTGCPFWDRPLARRVRPLNIDKQTAACGTVGRAATTPRDIPADKGSHGLTQSPS